MKKSIGSIPLAFFFIMVLLSGCATALNLLLNRNIRTYANSLVPGHRWRLDCHQ